MFVPFKTFCFQNVAFQVCCWMSFVLFCFNESKSCQIYSLNLRCGKALVNLASKVSINYHWSSFPTSLEHQEISEIATDSCSIISFPGSSCDPPSQEWIPDNKRYKTPAPLYLVLIVVPSFFSGERGLNSGSIAASCKTPANLNRARISPRNFTPRYLWSFCTAWCVPHPQPELRVPSCQSTAGPRREDSRVRTAGHPLKSF